MKRPNIEDLLTEPRKLTQIDIHDVILWCLHLENLMTPSRATVVLEDDRRSMFYQISKGNHVVWLTPHTQAGKVGRSVVAAKKDEKRGWIINREVAPTDLTLEAVGILQAVKFGKE